VTSLYALLLPLTLGYFFPSKQQKVKNLTEERPEILCRRRFSVDNASGFFMINFIGFAPSLMSKLDYFFSERLWWWGGMAKPSRQLKCNLAFGK